MTTLNRILEVDCLVGSNQCKYFLIQCCKHMHKWSIAKQSKRTLIAKSLKFFLNNTHFFTDKKIGYVLYFIHKKV